MTELSDPHIREAVAAARELRGRLGIDRQAPFDRDLLDCVELELGMGVCILDMPNRIAGAYIRRGLRSYIFIQAENYPTRQRFTIAHELGHHCLGHSGVLESYQDVGRDTLDPAEQQANYFASELLHPVEAVQAWLDADLGRGTPPNLADVVRLADHFHVSPPAMLYRLSKGDFEGIDRALLDKLWTEVNEFKRHLALAEELEIGHGRDALSQHWEKGVWPRLPQGIENDAASMIAAHVRKLFPPAATEAEDEVGGEKHHERTSLWQTAPYRYGVRHQG